MRLHDRLGEPSRKRLRGDVNRIKLLAALLLISISVATGSKAFAGNLDAVRHFNIDAKTLDKALLQFAAQAHVQMSIASQLTATRALTGHLNGTFTGRQALAALLKGSGLKYVEHANTIEILPAIAGDLRAEGSDPASNHTAPPDELTMPPGEAATEPVASAGHHHHKPALSEVVITGSRLATTLEEVPQEVRIYDSAQINQSGQNTVVDFLDTLPGFSLGKTPYGVGIGTTVSIRGLPVGTTLVLLDGHRLENSGLTNGSFFDLSNIPLAAVDRIEVDEGGASAIYGSDAIGGVVNIITKKDLNGLSITAKYGWGKDVSNVRTTLAWGKQFEKGGISVIASYDIDSGLKDADRLLTGSNNYSSYGGSNNNYPMCFPGNVFSETGTPLPGAPMSGVTTYAAVTGSATGGKPSLSQFTYGALNECSIVAGGYSEPANHRAGVLVEGHIDLAPRIQAFASLMYSRLTQFEVVGDAGLFGTQAFQEYTVSAANPYNPFGTTVGIAESLPSLPEDENLRTDFFRPLVGVKGSFLRTWQWEASAWISQDSTKDLLANEDPNYSAIQDALNSSNPTTALNPFVDGPVAPQPLLQSLFSGLDTNSMGRDDSAEAFVRGSLLQLPAGDVRAVLGGDYVRSTLYYDAVSPPPSDTNNYERKYTAVFAEANIPIITRHSGSHSWPLVNATISARHDQYSDFGGNTTEEYGLEIRPLTDIALRGTYGNAFAAPTLLDVHSPQYTAESFISDPTTGVPSLVPTISGGNPELRPLTGRSHTIGIVYSGGIAGLVLSATQWQVVENNAIQSIAAQVIVDNESLFPGRVERNSAGQIVSVTDTFVNFGSFDAAGIDYELAYRHGLGTGEISVGMDATQTYHYTQALAPGATSIEAVSQAEDDGDWAPRWKSEAWAGWSNAGIGLQLDGRYTGSYDDYDSTRRIGNFWLIDTHFRVNLGEKLSGSLAHWLDGAYVEGGATNLFNRAPQFSNYGFGFVGYDEAQMSIAGRLLYIELGVGW